MSNNSTTWTDSFHRAVRYLDACEHAEGAVYSFFISTTTHLVRRWELERLAAMIEAAVNDASAVAR